MIRGAESCPYRLDPSLFRSRRWWRCSAGAGGVDLVLGGWDWSRRFMCGRKKHQTLRVFQHLVPAGLCCSGPAVLLHRGVSQDGRSAGSLSRCERTPAGCCPACVRDRFQVVSIILNQSDSRVYITEKLDLSWPPVSPKEDLNKERFFSQWLDPHAGSIRAASTPVRSGTAPGPGFVPAGKAANIPSDWLSHLLSGDDQSRAGLGFVSICSINPGGRLQENRSDCRVLGTGRGGVADGRKS